jgi:hypothetical protein
LGRASLWLLGFRGGRGFFVGLLPRDGALVLEVENLGVGKGQGLATWRPSADYVAPRHWWSRIQNGRENMSGLRDRGMLDLERYGIACMMAAGQSSPPLQKACLFASRLAIELLNVHRLAFTPV